MNQNKAQLKLDWCSYEAATYAVKHWHYSRRMPVGKMVKIGVWEDGHFIGCVLFSRGANNNMLKPYGLEQTQGCELTRIALTTHRTPVSRVMAIAFKMLVRFAPGLRLVISFADPAQGHIGAIYQATNWIYAGLSRPDIEYLIDGKQMHRRSVLARFGTSIGQKKVYVASKHRYLYPLDDEMRVKILPLAISYPKRATSIEGDALSAPTERGGFNATVALPNNRTATLLEHVEVPTHG